jgi:tryptophan synthase beta chain
VGPEHSYWKETGRVDYLECGDAAAMEAFDKLARTEGIIAALETSHAVAKAMEMARQMPPSKHVLICLSGRGDKDAMEIARLRGESW